MEHSTGKATDLTVRGPWLIASLFEVDIVDITSAGAVTERRHANNTRGKGWGSRLEESVLEKLEEKEMTHVVGAELTFIAVYCTSFGGSHNLDALDCEPR